MKDIYRLLEKMFRRFKLNVDGEKIFNIISNNIRNYNEIGSYKIPIVSDIYATIKLTKATNSKKEYEIVSINNKEKIVRSQEVL